MIKPLYKPAGMIANVLGGLLADAIFKNGWKIAAREDDAPTATDASRGWHEILLAAAIEGLSSPCQGSARPRRRRGTRKLTAPSSADIPAGQRAHQANARLPSPLKPHGSRLAYAPGTARVFGWPGGRAVALDADDLGKARADG
jgi:hypothetical protein